MTRLCEVVGCVYWPAFTLSTSPPLHLSTSTVPFHLSQFHQLTESDACRDRIDDLSEKFAGKKILLGVDRVDYIKGM